MLSLHVNSPVPNTLFAPKLNPSRSQTGITPPFSLRKVRARGSSAEVAVKENEQRRRRRSNERISDLSSEEEEESPAGLNREAMPRHVAVIMDGNVRWARQRGLPSSAGHEAGVRSLRELVELCCRWGVEVLTVFAFSYDNWVRPQVEVEFLMKLFKKSIKSELEGFISEGIRISMIGDSSKLPKTLQELVSDAEERTKNNSNFQLIVAVSYSGKYDVVQACKSIAQKVKDDVIRLNDIDESLIELELETSCTDYPYPDLLIRTTGELRVSNFLLWQLAYTEFFFVQTLWPDFGKAEFVEAVW